MDSQAKESASRKRFAPIKSILAAAVAVIALLGQGSPASAQLEPGSQVRLILPTAPGGVIDGIGRLIAEEVSQILNIKVIPTNRAGAGGVIGAQTVAQAKPDGLTLCFCHSGPITVLVSQQTLPYDPAKDFIPITRAYNSHWFITVRKESPFSTLADVVAAAKARPGKITYSSPAGIGSSVHLSGVQFERMAGIQMTHVPYPGTAPMTVDVLNGNIDVGLMSPEFIRSLGDDKVKALASVSAKRSPGFPNVPTIAESGYPGYDAGSWTGLFAPAGTPPAVIKQLYDATQVALRRPKVKDTVTQWLELILDDTPEQFAKFLKEDTENYRKLADAVQRDPNATPAAAAK